MIQPDLPLKAAVMTTVKSRTLSTAGRQRRSDKSADTTSETVIAIGPGALTVFIVFHIIAIFIWSIPSEARPIAGVREMLRPYMVWAGLDQSWDTFGPNPKAVDQYLKAVVITETPHILVFAFPRMEELSIWQKYRKERYRKFIESILPDKYSGLWPDIAKQAARQFDNPQDRPTKVLLVKFESKIDPRLGLVGAEASAKPALFFEQYIEPEDLK